MTAPPRRWARWTDGAPPPADVAQIARSHGMQVISWQRSATWVFSSFALWGTRLQLAATEEEWTRKGIRWWKKQPVGAEPAPPLLRRKDWAERWFTGDVFEEETES